MFIELTDHLRCLGGHEEAYLVLLPDRMKGREVQAGHLGCPVCGWSTAFSEGVVEFGGGRWSDASTCLTGEAVQALLGLSGPGGYVALAGSAAAVIPELERLMPGIALVAVNPPPALAASGASILRARELPLKSSSMRGVVLGEDLAGDPGWVASAVRATLPGLRVVGAGELPDLPGIEILGAAAGVWVSRRLPLSP
jgi:hypothetical protein